MNISAWIFSQRKLFVFAALFACTLLLLFGIKQASAQEQVTPQTPSYSSRVNSDVPRNQHTHTQIVLIELAAALSCQLTGIDPLSPTNQCLGIDPITRKIGFAEQPSDQQVGGLIGLTTNLIGTMYVPPASTGQFIGHMASNFGISKSALAAEQNEQGTGFNELAPLLRMWTKVRNIAYLTIVFVFVVVGIAIMLRIHIDPRTVMTVQNQIPRIVVSLVLITFSFAIVGFLVDAMWTTTYLGVNLLTSDEICEKSKAPIGKVTTDELLNNPIAFTSDIFGDKTGCFGTLDGITGIAESVGSTIGTILTQTFLAFVGGNEQVDDCDPGLKWKFWGSLDLQDCAKAGVFFTIRFLISIIGFLIVAIAIFIALIRLWIMLLKSYIRILFYTVLGPFWILIGLLPGNTLGVKQWIRTLTANLAVFPAAVLFLVAAAIFAADSTINNPNNAFVPPLVGHPNFNDNLGVLLAFGLILLAPELINMLRDALKSPPSKYGAALGAGLKAGSPMGALQGAGQLGYNLHYIGQMPGADKFKSIGSKLSPFGRK